MKDVALDHAWIAAHIPHHGTMCLLQLLVGALVDRRYDPGILRFYAYAVWYPLVYWMFLSATTVLSMSWLFRRPQAGSVRWNTQRSGKEA